MLALAVVICMLIGMVGVVAPFVPGLLIIWLAALIYGLVGGFGTAGITAFVVITLLFATGQALGFVLPGRAAQQSSAANGSLFVGAACAIIGFFIIPVFGFMLGGLLGVFAWELIQTESFSRARSTTWSTLTGFGISMLTQLCFGVAMILTWGLWVLGD